MSGATRKDAERALQEAAALAPAIRVDLDSSYLKAIALVESLASNQSGADKTWVSRADDVFRQHYRNARQM